MTPQEAADADVAVIVRAQQLARERGGNPNITRPDINRAQDELDHRLTLKTKR